MARPVPGDLDPGVPVRVEYRKFDGSPHWVFQAFFLGTDEHGGWLGGGPGIEFSRPGMRFVGDNHWVTLASADRGFMFTRYAPSPSGLAEIYIDLTTVPVWERLAGGVPVVRTIDLDLDVIRTFAEDRPWLDDEDEFAEHQVAMGYPAELVEATESEAHRLLREAGAEEGPFGTVGRRWLEQCQARFP